MPKTKPNASVRWETMLDRAPLLFDLLRSDGRIIYANQIQERALGYPYLRGEGRGQRVAAARRDLHGGRIAEHIRQSVKEAEYQRGDEQEILPGGVRFHALFLVTPGAAMAPRGSTDASLRSE